MPESFTLVPGGVFRLKQRKRGKKKKKKLKHTEAPSPNWNSVLNLVKFFKTHFYKKKNVFSEEIGYILWINHHGRGQKTRYKAITFYLTDKWVSVSPLKKKMWTIKIISHKFVLKISRIRDTKVPSQLCHAVQMEDLSCFPLSFDYAWQWYSMCKIKFQYRKKDIWPVIILEILYLFELP